MSGNNGTGRPSTGGLIPKMSSKTAKNSPSNSLIKGHRPKTTNKNESTYTVTQPTTASTNNRGN